MKENLQSDVKDVDQEQDSRHDFDPKNRIRSKNSINLVLHSKLPNLTHQSQQTSVEEREGHQIPKRLKEVMNYINPGVMNDLNKQIA